MRRLSQRCYYVIETLMIRSPGYQLLFVACLLTMLALLGGLVVHLFHPRAFGNISESVWWAFLRLTDPGYLGSDRGFVPRLVSTILTVSGSVLFLGAMVAVMTTWLDRLLAFLASGRSTIFERDHILVIGWNERTRALVEELVHASRRLLEQGSPPAIAILCQRFDPGMQRQLLQELEPSVRKRCRLLIRAGNPLEEASLERVDFQHARSIILVSQATGEPSLAQLSDVTLAKVLMSLKSRAPGPEGFPGTIVVEVSNPANKILLESLGWESNTEAVVGDDFLGRLFCQSVRYPGLSRVYRRLLTDSFEDSVLLLPASQIEAQGRSLRELVGRVAQGVPIGMLPRDGKQSQLRLLQLDDRVTADDLLVVIVPGQRATESAPATEQSPVPGKALWRQSPSHHLQRRRLLCAGLGRSLRSFLGELTHFGQEQFEITLVWDEDCPKERERLADLAAQSSNLELEFIISALAEESSLGKLRLERFDSIVLLADRRKDILLADAATVLQHVLLKRYCEARSVSPGFVVELNDEDNRPLISGAADIVMSMEIVSHLLAQVAVQRSLAWVYEELFTRGGSELRLRSLDSLGLSEEQLEFGICQQLCMAHNSIAVGVVREEGVLVRPAADATMHANDQLVVVEWE